MEKKHIEIDGIPAVLWGAVSDRLFIAVHGDQSHKEDAAIEILAGEAANRGYGTVSFDLPEHGDRRNECRLCNPKNAVEDLRKVMSYAREMAKGISLFGCSIGAYFGMLAFSGKKIDRSLFLSPVVDMRFVIENLMRWFDISKERLEAEKVIETPVKTLYWDYYSYVLNHPVFWEYPTDILIGENDDVGDCNIVSAFAKRRNADVTIVKDTGHYFHTKKELAVFQSWVQKVLFVPLPD